MTRAVLYLRQSLDRTGEGMAVARQEKECRALADAKGWEVTRVYSDNDIGASTGSPRPAYMAMMEAVRAGSVDVVVAYAADRLTRRPIEMESLIDALEASKTKLATVAGEVDLSTPYGKAVARIFSAIARQEVEQKGARQAIGNRQRAELGKASWTRRPYGYQREDGWPVVVPEEAKVIRQAAQAVLKGATLASVVAGLNAAGKTTSTGAGWSASTLRRALLNPRVAGRIAYKGAVLSDGPAILDDDTFDRLTAVLTDPRRRRSPSNRTKYLLSGLVRCGKCGGAMFTTTNNSAKPSAAKVYRCSAKTCYISRRSEDVDTLVEAAVVARLSRPDAVSLLSNPKDVEALREAKVELLDRREVLTTMLGEGLLDHKAAKAQLAKIAADLEDTDRELAAMSGDNPLAQVVGLGDVADRWASLPLKAKRSVIALLLDVVIMPAGRGASFDPRLVQVTWR